MTASTDATTPTRSKSAASRAPETQRQAGHWDFNFSAYRRAAFCKVDASQASWGHQLGFSNVHPIRECCAGLAGPVSPSGEARDRWIGAGRGRGGGGEGAQYPTHEPQGLPVQSGASRYLIECGMTASLRKMSAQAKGRLAPLDRVVVRDETGAVLLDMDGMDLRSYLVMATLDQVAVTLQTLISHGQLRPVAGQPWSFVATGEAQVAAWQASARLVRRRYAEDEAA